jgi:hypothetical protein
MLSQILCYKPHLQNTIYLVETMRESWTNFRVNWGWWYQEKTQCLPGCIIKKSKCIFIYSILL